MAARRKEPSVRLVIISAAGFAAAEFAMAIMPTYLTFALAGIPVGFAALTMLTSANATVQTTTPPSMRGRVMSLYMMVFMGATPLGSPLVGWIGEHFGPRIAVGVGAGASAAVVIAVLIHAVVRGRLDVAFSPRRPFFTLTTVAEIHYPED